MTCKGDKCEADTLTVAKDQDLGSSKCGVKPMVNLDNTKQTECNSGSNLGQRAVCCSPISNQKKETQESSGAMNARVDNLQTCASPSDEAEDKVVSCRDEDVGDCERSCQESAKGNAHSNSPCCKSTKGKINVTNANRRDEVENQCSDSCGSQKKCRGGTVQQGECCQSKISNNPDDSSNKNSSEDAKKDCCMGAEENGRLESEEENNLDNNIRHNDQDFTICPCCADLLLEGYEDNLNDSNLLHDELPSSKEKAGHLSEPESGLLPRMILDCCRTLRRRCCVAHICEEIWEDSLSKKRNRSSSTNQSSAFEAFDVRNAASLRKTSRDSLKEDIETDRDKQNGIPLRLIIGGMDCADCAPRVEKAVKRLHGVHFVNLDYFQAMVDLTYDDQIIQVDAIRQFIARATAFDIKVDQTYGGHSKAGSGSSPSASMSLDYNFINRVDLDELESDAPWRVTLVKKMRASTTVRVTFPTNGPSASQPRSVHNFFSKMGGTLLASSEHNQAVSEVHRDVIKLLLRFIISLLLCIPTLVFAWAKLPHPDLRWELAALILATFILINAYPFFDASIRSIVYLRQTDLLVLVSISVAVAYTYSLASFIVRQTGYVHVSEPFFETVALLITLIYLGRFTQATTRMRVANEIQNINTLTSTTVTILNRNQSQDCGSGLLLDGKDTDTSTLDKRLLQYGDTIIFGPDSMILTDGIVVGTSSSAVDESSITGESIPVFKRSGMPVYAGSRNLESPLLVQVTNLVHENSLSHISQAISRAFSTRSTFQDFSDRLAAVLLPVAVVAASVAFLIWSLVERYVRENDSAAAATIGLGYGIAILVVSCPCALGLSVPLITSVSILTGAREGVLYRSSESISRAAKVDVVAFDKTGTLSTGEFSVVRVLERLSHYMDAVHAITKDSKHPVARAVYKHVLTQMEERTSNRQSQFNLEHVRSVPGKGISASLKGFTILAGSANFTGTSHVKEVAALKQAGLTLFTVTIGGRLVVAYGLQDGPRPETAKLVATLRSQGKDVMLISGDNSESVNRFANVVGINPDMVYSQCLPEQKAKIIDTLRSSKRRVAFVGDGTNDSIAFAAADVSFAIATASDIAKGTADILLLSSRLDRGLLNALHIARIGRRINILGLSWCVLYAVLAILLAGGVAIRFSIAPRWAGLGEVVSVVPIIILGFSVPVVWRMQQKQYSQ